MLDMDIKETAQGVILTLKVKPSSGEFGFAGGVLKLKSPPEGGKANMEIVKGLKKLFGLEVSLLSGFKSREKLILIQGAKAPEIRSILNADKGCD
jgi:uncharacterized protein (TIGR00251 family)